LHILHLVLHFIIPAIIAKLAFAKHWRISYLVMMSTMLVDLDHLLANPLYALNRCSIGFHPLHEPIAIAVYGILCFVPKLRLVGIGLIIHMSLDSADCFMTNGVWYV
jgi:hypothetical protein